MLLNHLRCVSTIQPALYHSRVIAVKLSYNNGHRYILDIEEVMSGVSTNKTVDVFTQSIPIWKQLIVVEENQMMDKSLSL